MLSIPGVLFIGSLSTNLFILAESKIFSASSWFSLILSGSVVHFNSSSVSFSAVSSILPFKFVSHYLELDTECPPPLYRSYSESPPFSEPATCYYHDKVLNK